MAELHDFVRKYATRKYREIFENDVKMLLLESDPEILKGVDPDLARRAMTKLRSDSIEVRTSARVSRCSPEGVEVNDNLLIKAGLVVWATGVKANPVLESTPLPKDRLGRLMVNPYLRVEGYPEVYAVGDNAYLEHASPAKASRPVIPIALHQGRRAAENIVAALIGKELKQADYKPKGYLVSLGMNDAVLKVWRLKLHGFPAWVIWNAYHVFKLVGLKKQIQVAADWSLASVFPRDGSMIVPSERCERCQTRAGEPEREYSRFGSP